MHDLVIRGGSVIDGTGAPARLADVAIDDGRISRVGDVPGDARETIDASGKIVTPGFVDIHTHFDGQITWDPTCSPSSWHGVTTVVMGNCGVGFAPVAPGKEEWLIGLMEGVEDIPGGALTEGMTWAWETFPEYLDYIEQLPMVMDIGTQVPHGAVRAYVMGERGAKNEPANPEDIAEMALVVKDAIAAGALGFSTSRTLAHRAIDGEPVPGTFAAEDELFGIGAVLGELDAGLFEVAAAGVTGDDLSLPLKEVAWMRKLAATIKRPVTFGLTQVNTDPEHWRGILDATREARANGSYIVPQVLGRTITFMMTLDSRHPFLRASAYREIRDLPLAERAAEMQQPARRAAILEQTNGPDPSLDFITYDRMFLLDEPLDYEPHPDTSVAARAERDGVDPLALVYDLLTSDDGRNMIMSPLFNYATGDLAPVRDMITDPNTVFGLADAGAHCRVLCDAGTPTFMLTHWTRDRTRGERLPIEWIIKKQTHDTAELFGLNDRGALIPGLKGDVNVIDYDALKLERPQVAYDLPGGAKRLVQGASGYAATIVSGTVVRRNDQDTGERPGVLLRGAQPAPAGVVSA